MMRQFAIFLIATMVFAGTAYGQARKCTGPDGKVTYSDVLCSTASKSAETLVPLQPSAAPQPNRPSQASVYERELSGKIASYLAQNDFDHATSLAVTAEHFQMITAARQSRLDDEAKKKAEAKAAKPVVCYTVGQSIGFGMSVGKAICR